ncbi:Dyp-type peroxidase [Photobacterium sp. 1_MG-2023]|uniref:Dyp-type peroxidase n=1 Tax=Photobacterium sp. 1_MG-2023 TaxID=3062646 RepID=UPI0026E1A514|nr:Dyp-type peroxidase [Photobacterium sp. 1_MG-2023]MDO6705236.1 Dyp-type peroxidase [Photobacterium sp. 1_MG-2023]
MSNGRVNVTPQSAILPESGPFSLVSVFNLVGNQDKVIRQCQGLLDVVNQLNQQHVSADIHLSVGFGKSFWQRLEQGVPEDFEEFVPLGSGDVTAPATGGDLLLHLHSNRHDLNFHLLSTFMQSVATEVELLDETHGFRYLDARDLTGFIDGTENPKKQEARRDVTVIPQGPFAGGSFVMLQRFVHNLPAWHAVHVAQQEKIIGRTKPDSVELEDVAENSHVGRVDLKENGKGLKIVRHSLPYGTMSGDHGLLFIAYCAQQRNFREMLDSMYGEKDGQTDKLLDFTKAVTGAYFFVPSAEMLIQL